MLLMNKKLFMLFFYVLVNTAPLVDISGLLYATILKELAKQRLDILDEEVLRNILNALVLGINPDPELNMELAFQDLTVASMREDGLESAGHRVIKELIDRYLWVVTKNSKGGAFW